MLSFIKQGWGQANLKAGLAYSAFLSLLATVPSAGFADSNPWGGDTSGVDPSDLQKTISDDTTGTLKTASIVVGSLMLLGGVTVIIKTLNRDADERRDHGNSLMTLLLAGLASVVGLVLLGIAWKGLSYSE